MRRTTLIFRIISGCLIFTSCQELAPGAPEGYEELDEPITGLSVEEQRRHSAGDTQFDKVYTIEEGLGPVFNNVSCNSCHPGEGKGHPNNKFIRFGQSTPGLNPGHDYGLNPFANFGDGMNQLQNRAIPGYEPEKLPDGAPYTELLAPVITGLGYLDAVSDQTLLDMVAENAQRTDQIRGRVHYRETAKWVKIRPNSIPDAQGAYIHRFGKKALSYDLKEQTVGAFNQDMGIVTTYMPIEPYDGEPGDPEASNQTVKDIEFYLKTLKAPERQPTEFDQEVLAGEQLFVQIDCATCHRPVLKTGYSPISVLNQVEFHAFTDLLLHDMGPDLDDGYTEGNVETYEWKTPPLWGLGAQFDIQGGTLYLLHDGRANSVEEAISYHGGEAEASRNKFYNLSSEEQDQLIRYIESL